MRHRNQLNAVKFARLQRARKPPIGPVGDASHGPDGLPCDWCGYQICKLDSHKPKSMRWAPAALKPAPEPPKPNKLFGVDKAPECFRSGAATYPPSLSRAEPPKPQPAPSSAGFAIGDVVRVVAPASNLTMGREYAVIGASDAYQYVAVVGDDGLADSWHPSRFELVRRAVLAPSVRS